VLGVRGVGDEGVIIITGAGARQTFIVGSLGGLDIVDGRVFCRCKRWWLCSLKVAALEIRSAAKSRGFTLALS
jgi:hypothetical protein